MSTAVSPAFRAAANAARMAFLDTGASKASAAVYGTARPPAGDPPGGDAMVVMRFAKPCGTIEEDGRLSLTPDTPEGEMILNGDGATPALWVRFFNGAGAWAFDADVSTPAGTALLKFVNVNLIAGGRAPLILPSYLG